MTEVRLVEADEGGSPPSWAWWVTLLVGLLSLAAGIILVFKPSNSLATLAVIFGIFLLIDGIAELVASIAGRVDNRALAAILGVLGIVIGIVLIRHPFHGVTAIGLLIGIWLVAAGVVRFVRSLAVGTRPVLGVLIALLEIFVGIAVVANPHIGYATLAILTGIWLILSGIGTIALGVEIRRAAHAA
ncbi:MAG TPA: DUF308 domain-containing protein [Solirubrobacteraceae bacterium]|jgi:uncharacterized membrane protein HdeD (DUF308 family)